MTFLQRYTGIYLNRLHKIVILFIMKTLLILGKIIQRFPDVNWLPINSGSQLI